MLGTGGSNVEPRSKSTYSSSQNDIAEDCLYQVNALDFWIALRVKAYCSGVLHTEVV